MSIWGKCSLQGSITYCFISFFSWIGTCTTEWGGNTVRLFSISWRNCFLRSRENTLLLPSNVETTILQIRHLRIIPEQHILKKVMYCSVEYDLNPIFIYVGQKKNPSLFQDPLLHPSSQRMRFWLWRFAYVFKYNCNFSLGFHQNNSLY